MAPVPGAMNAQQASAGVDPVLSSHARGYQNAEFVGSALFPTAPIANRSVKVLNFGKGAFRKYMQTRRAPGANVPRMQFGFASGTVSLEQTALSGVVPVETQEEAAKVPNVDMGSVAVTSVQNILRLGREAKQAALARDPNNYAATNKIVLAAGDRFTDDTSKPKDLIKEGKEAIRKMIGREPNVLLLGPSAYSGLDDHPTINEKFKYTSSDSITTKMLEGYFDIDKVVVGKAVALPENASEDDPAEDVWGSDAILAYVPPGSSYMVPAYGYTYELSGYPMVETPYYDRETRSWVYPTFEEWQAYLTGAEGGFLIQNAGASV